MAGRTAPRWALAAAVAGALALLTGLLARAGGVSPGLAPVQGGPDPPVVALVNGEAVDLSALERVKEVYQANRPDLPVGEAYRLALETLIRHRVLAQEAARRGLQVAPEQVRAYQEQIAAALAAHPEMAQALEDQAQVSGWDAGARAQAEAEAYRQGLLVAQLYRVWLDESPPTGQESAGGSQPPGGPAGWLAVMAIPYKSPDRARADLARMLRRAGLLSQAELVTAFDALARQRRGLRDGEFSHHTYHFDHASQLPAYARQALRGPQGRPRLFVRRDGSAVLYLVVKAEEPMSARPAGAGRPSQAFADWVAAQEGALLQNARVQVFAGRLPPEARAAWQAR